MSKRFGKPEIILIFVIMALIILERLTAMNAGFAAWNTHFFNLWASWAVRFGYLGAFILAFVGNLNFVLVFPYSFIIFFLATTGLNPIFLGIATGLGAVGGEFSGYFLGRFGSRVFEGKHPGVAWRLREVMERRPTLIPVLLYIFTLLPVPADLIFIPLGLLRYRPLKVLWPAALGKISAGIIIAYAGHTFYHLAGRTSLALTLRLEFVTLIAIAIVVYIFFKIPWDHIIDRFTKTKLVNKSADDKL